MRNCATSEDDGLWCKTHDSHWDLGSTRCLVAEAALGRLTMKEASLFPEENA